MLKLLKLAVLFFLILLPESDLLAQSTVRVGVYSNQPLTYIDSNGNARGIFMELLQYIAAKENWTLEYVSGSWDECLERLNNGDIDLLGPVAYTDARALQYDYMIESVLTNWGRIYGHQGKTAESILDLKNRKIAVLHSDVYFDSLRQMANQFDLNCRFIEVFRYSDVLQLIADGRCDNGLVNEYYGSKFESRYNIIKTPVIINPQHIFFAAPKGKNRQLLGSLDIWMRRLKADSQSIYHRLLKTLSDQPDDRLVSNNWILVGLAVGGILLALCAVLIFFQRAQVKARSREARASGQKYRSLFAHNVTATLIIEEDFTISEANSKCEALSGYSLEEIGRMKVTDFVAYEDRERIKKHHILRRTAGENPPSQYQLTLIDRDGKHRNVLMQIGLIPGTRQSMASMIDISSQIETEKELRRSEEKYRSVIESLKGGFFEVDIKGDATFVNTYFHQMMGYSHKDIIGHNFRQYIDLKSADKIFDAFHSAFKTKTAFETEVHDIRLKNEKQISIELSAAPIMDAESRVTGFRGIVRDISQRLKNEEEKHKLQKQFQKAQKMESIGTLTGGITHNFNNILMGIQGNATLSLMDKSANDPDQRRMEDIIKLVQSGSHLTYQLLGYARGGRYQTSVLSLNRLIEETADTFAMTRKEIRVNRDLDPNLPGIEADQGQIQQVLLNLCVNAADAMPKGGNLMLITSSITHAEIQGKPFKLRPGRYLILSVRDNGMGMDEETRERIFEPFFTTKKMGRGTGLGLASVYGIIKGHGGYIEVQSEVGMGTSFSIYLPTSEKKVTIATPKRHSVARGQGLILIVDDEKMILDTTAELIKALGYQVIKASSGSEAIKIYASRHGEVDLVILDMIMPDMGGGETYDQLKAINPAIKAILFSGYSRNSQAKEILRRGCTAFLQKPFDVSLLSRKIKEILSQKQECTTEEI